MRPKVRQGWHDDPFGLHERRYFSAGEPTKLVEDAGVESYDPPPPGTRTEGAPRSAQHDGFAEGVARVEPPVPAAAGGATDPAGPAPTPGSPRRRRRTLAAVAATIVLVAGLTIGLAVSGGDDDGHASAAVTRSTDATLQEGSAHLALTMHGTVGPASVDANGRGAVDFANQASTFALTMHVLGQTETLQMVQDGQTVYVSIPQITQLVPGKSWASVSNTEHLPDAGSLSPFLGAGNPSDILKQLSAHGATVTPLAPSTIDGVAVQGYRVIPPSRVGGSSAGPPHTALDVYIDGANLVRRVNLSVSGTAESMPMNVDATLDLSDYGSPVTVTPPPADQVVPFSQLLGPGGPLASAKDALQL
jgi:hypothetical protein